MASSASPAVGRALDILTHLARQTGAVGASAIARDLGLPRSTTYHLLAVLEERGFVLRLPESRGWALGASAYGLTSAYTPHEGLERLARPVMRALAAEQGVTVHLGILRGPLTLYLLKESPAGATDEPSLVTAVGVLLPAHLTASGRAILAQLPEATVRALYTRPGDFVSRTGRGPRGLGDLLGELGPERARGWSEEVELVTPGLRSVGAAVFDLHRQPVAALSCTWRARVPARDAEPIVSALLAGASEVSRRLGG
ncbi:IclR family transcriptional regulator [Propioniciclava sp. MC1683]|uniref:IclR family transcriptional regulator n=1 Tax=Propioniciclava sp. MC1683 TaxID=2760309 RepID=UPI001600A7F4|nr:IclR family transcriptional regulator [Propioniciclava sp. MC1683]MBB1502811.1 IclR family transcriptional regulator [Propioniciclava sp. MC1683]